MAEIPEILLTREPLDVIGVSRAVEDAGYGAIVTFAGTVRDQARGNQVLYLEYEAYDSLAKKQLRWIVDEAQERWGVRCAIAHRLGRLEIGECSVVIAVASPHRAEAFEACHWALDTLKTTVPIWKHEFFEGGTHWIEGGEAVLSAPPLPDYWEGTGLI